MIRRFPLTLAALTATAALSAPAFAQYYPPPPPGYYRDGPGPRVYDERGRRIYEERDPRVAVEDERDGLPPPGFAVPPGARAPDMQAAPPPQQGGPVLGPQDVLRPPAPVGAAPNAVPNQATGSVPPAGASVAALPPEDQPEVGAPKELPPHLKRQLVDFTGREAPGTIVIDTPNTYLYLVLGQGKAMRYGIGVGREGFTWAGAEKISRMAEWPDWHPPQEMIERQPYLPRFMAGGPGNPLGARALYLGKTLYRIHGTNQPSTIGSFVSSGCIRLLNDDIEDLYSRVNVGTRVVVLPGEKPASTASNAPPAQPYNPLAPPAANSNAQARNVPPAPTTATGPTDLTAPNQGAITSQPLPPPPGRTIR